MISLITDVVARAVDQARAWCRIPSFAGNEAGLARQAEAIRDWLTDMLGAKIVAMASEGRCPPVIHARLDVGAARTVLLYNMYDVMPAPDHGWSVPPFEGTVGLQPGVGRALIARGAENNKGPLAGMLQVLLWLKEEKRLHCNVEILIEGQEESGSAGLRRYLGRPDCPLRPSVAALFPSFCEYGGGAPRVFLGFSGIAKGRVVVEAGTWGGPRQPIHSSNAAWIANPASRLIAALTCFGENPTGAMGQIDLDPEASLIIADLAKTFDPAAELRFRHAQKYAVGGGAESLLRHVLSTATATLSSLSTEPPDADGIIPTVARARFALRTPPGLNPRALLDAYGKRLSGDNLVGVQLEVDDSYPGHRYTRAAPGVAELLHAYAIAPEAPQIWPWAIGASPAFAFAPHSGSFLIGGLGRGGNAHTANEFLALETFERFVASLARWLDAMAA